MKQQTFTSAIAFVSLILSTLATNAAENPALPRPNIVFVLIDDFGYADSGP